MREGQTVYWQRTTNGRPVETQIRRIETITRPDGSQLTCATLTCNRFVPVTELLESDDGTHKVPEPNSPAQETPVQPEAASPPAAEKTASKAGRRSEPSTPAGPADPVRLKPECGSLLIDFNNLLVRAWHAGAPREIHAVKSMFLTVAAAVRSLRPSGIVFCLDGGHDHRAKLYPAYKAHRPPSDPDLVRQRKLAIDAIDFAGLQLLRAEGFEADDVIATLAKREPAAVVLSSDKDLLSLGGHAKIYHPWGAGKFVTAEDVLGVPAGQVLDYLALCGDASDGVPGVKGIGEKTALKLLSDHGDLETILAKARFLHISGAAGKNLRDGAADALLSQQLVQLVTNLQLAELQPWRPRHGWQQRLTEIRLGSVAAILDGIADLLQSGEPKAESRTDSSVDMPVMATSEPAFRPPLSSVELDQLHVQYCQGRKYSGRDTANPWRRDTQRFQAWDQGYRNVPFSLDVEPSAESRKPATTAAGSLFG
jgi:5'-3' exonuclease